MTLKAKLVTLTAHLFITDITNKIDIGGLRRCVRHVAAHKGLTFFENLVYFIMKFFNRVSALTFSITLVDIDNIQRRKDFF